VCKLKKACILIGGILFEHCTFDRCLNFVCMGGVFFVNLRVIVNAPHFFLSYCVNRILILIILIHQAVGSGCG
jgi:hypothetical protein